MSNQRNIKKILIFSTAYYPFVGGAEVAVKEITDRLGSDFEFDLITAKLQKDLPKVEKLDKVNVYRVGIGNLIFDKMILPFFGAILAWRLNKKRSYYCFWGIMVTFGSGAGYIFNILRVLTGKKKVPIVLTLQEGDSENYLQYKWAGLIDLSWRMALWNTDFLTGISNFLLNRAKKRGYEGRQALVPNGVDVNIFSKEINEKTKEELKMRLSKKQNEVFLVTVSRLVHKNATDDIISALTHLPENISLVVIGKGDLGPDLQKQARDLGVSEKVKFLGFVPYADLPKYFSACDIFIRPSRSEGFGNSFIEAMAAGLPVIATPVGGIPDFIDDGETGVFCSPDNPQSIAQAVNLLLKDEALRDKIKDKAKKRVVENYSWDHIAVKMKDVLESLFIPNP